MNELKHCPFCGEPVTIGQSNPVEIYCKNRHYFSYADRMYFAYGQDEVEKVIDEWNTRNGEPKRCCMNCKHVEYIDGDRYLDGDHMSVGCELDRVFELKGHASSETFEKNGIEVCDDWEAKE